MSQMPAAQDQRLAASIRAPMTGDQLTEQERVAVAYFFRRLKLVSPAEYDRMFPTPDARKEAQRDYAPYIKNFTRVQIDAGFDRLHTLRQQGDDNHRFLDVDKAIGLVQMAARQGVYSPRSGKFYIPKPDPEAQPEYRLPNVTRKERAEEARNKAMAELATLFTEDED